MHPIFCTHAGYAKANKKHDSSGDVVGGISQPSERIFYGPTESLDNHLSRIASLKGEGRNLVVSPQSASLQSPSLSTQILNPTQ